MKYFTAHFWQNQGGNKVPCFSVPDFKYDDKSMLILEHMQSREVEICIMAICKTKELGEMILSWKDEIPWGRAANNPKRWVEQADKDLRELFEKSIREVCVLIGIGKEISLLGDYGRALCIRGFFGRGTAERMENFRGEIREGTGILLTCPYYAKDRTEAEIGETLRFTEKCTEEKMGKRLRELSGVERTVEQGGALLLVVK